MKSTMSKNMKPTIIALCLAASLTACSTVYPPRDTSTFDKIGDQLKQAAQPKQAVPPAPGTTQAIPVAVPEAVSSSLLPPPRSTLPRASAKQLEQRFDLVVTDAPISQVLMSLVHDTNFSIMVKPKADIPRAPGATAPASVTGLTETVTINLKNVTLFEALDSIREVYGYDYTVDGTRIYVQQPELQTRLYQVDYIIGQRRGVSDLQVVGGASVGVLSNTSSGSSSGSTVSDKSASNYASVQASALSTMAKSNLWGEIEDALRTTLGCQIPKNLPNTARPVQAGGSGSGSSGTVGAAGGGSSSSSSMVARADVSFTGDNPESERQRGIDGCTDGRSMSISQMSGTIMVRGMPHEHRMIQKMLHTMQVKIERQVIIEAKIIDVELNSESQQGINWSGFRRGLHRFSVGANTNLIDGTTPLSAGGAILGSERRDFAEFATSTIESTVGGVTSSTSTSVPVYEVTPASTSLGQLVGTGLVGASGNAFAAGLGMALQLRNFSALINFLQTQGQVHVLSSPRIATLNSQKAVLKVGSEEPFVTGIDGGSVTATAGATPITVPPTLQYQPFFSGISLDVTPHIDERGNITLHVHTMVNSISEKYKPSLPSLNAVNVPFAVNTINETDSVVRTKDGQVVVIGGLMTEKVIDGRDSVPGAGDAPLFGALFRKGAQKSVKRELVILLKPTIVVDDNAWSNDINATHERIEALRPPVVVTPAPAAID